MGPATFLRVIKLTTDLYSVDSKAAEAPKKGVEPVLAPLTDEEEMVKYWKNFKKSKRKNNNYCFCICRKLR